ncbi:MAG: prepilin peptidase [Acidobacteria bacterium]|nr:prepilin peptidase [Acidobacteriota bacterium]
MNLLIPPPIPPLIEIVLLMTVAIAAFFDIRNRKIPNPVAVAGAFCGVAANGYLGGVQGLKTSVIGFVVAFGVYFLLYVLHAMGAGDVKLMGAVGAILGLRAWIPVLLATMILGAVFALVLALSKGRLRSTLWNVGYLARELAAFRAPWMTHKQLDVKQEGTLRLPHGASIAAGVVVVLAGMHGWI